MGRLDLFTILLAEDVAIDARRYGDLLAPLLGITKVEAKMMVRRGRGIFLEDLADDAARRMSEELRVDGIAHRLVKNEELPAMPVPRRVNWGQRSPGALRFKWTGDEAVLDFGWNQVGVVSLGLIAQEEWRESYSGVRFDHLPSLRRIDGDPDARDLVRENLILKIVSASNPAAPSKRKPGEPTVFERLASEYARKVKVFADVIDVGRSLWLRVAMDDISYLHDEQGVRFGDAWGLSYLVGDLVDHAPKTATLATLQLLDGSDFKDLVFLTSEEFSRYTRWHILKRELPCADTLSPSPEPPAPSTDAGFSSASPGPGTPSISP